MTPQYVCHPDVSTGGILWRCTVTFGSGQGLRNPDTQEFIPSPTYATPIAYTSKKEAEHNAAKAYLEILRKTWQ